MKNWNVLISKVIGESGSPLTEQRDISEEQLQFYKNSYTSHYNRNNSGNDDIETSFLENAAIIELEEEKETNTRWKKITLEECSIALKELPNGKSPGSE